MQVMYKLVKTDVNSATADIIHPGENWKPTLHHTFTSAHFDKLREHVWGYQLENFLVFCSRIKAPVNDLKMKRCLSAPTRTVLSYYHIWVQSGRMYYASFCASLLLAGSCNNAGCNGRSNNGKVAYLSWKLIFLGQIVVFRTANFHTSNSYGENHFITNICILSHWSQSRYMDLKIK